MDNKTNKTSSTNRGSNKPSNKGMNKNNENGMSRTEFAEEYSVDTGRKTNSPEKKTNRPNKCK